MRTRFRVIDHGEFIFIILDCKVETFCLSFFRDREKAFSAGEWVAFKNGRKLELHLWKTKLEFLQDKDSYNDISSEFTESDRISDIYFADITEEEVFSESEDDLPAQTAFHQQQAIPQKKKSKQNKDTSNLQGLPEPPVYYSE